MRPIAVGPEYIVVLVFVSVFLGLVGLVVYSIKNFFIRTRDSLGCMGTDVFFEIELYDCVFRKQILSCWGLGQRVVVTKDGKCLGLSQASSTSNVSGVRHILCYRWSKGAVLSWTILTAEELIDAGWERI